MQKLLLTSAGFETQGLLDAFHGLLDKLPSDTWALFIPTAAQDADAIAVLPKCMKDLLRAGIPANQIRVFDLHRPMALEELRQYDVVYMTGGHTHYLVERILDTGFSIPLRQFLEQGGVVVGVSAGSLAVTQLGLIDCTLRVHTPVGTPPGPVDPSEHPYIDLTHRSALLVVGQDIQVVE